MENINYSYSFSQLTALAKVNAVQASLQRSYNQLSIPSLSEGARKLILSLSYESIAKVYLLEVYRFDINGKEIFEDKHLYIPYPTA